MNARGDSFVVVSFLGRGQRIDGADSRPGYRRTAYDFTALTPKGRVIEPTTFFGVALLDYLRRHAAKHVQRWLVLGTSASQWQELVLALPEPDAEAHTDLYAAIDDKTMAGAVTTADL